jgi:catechol-2,3-dioxygenase
VHFALRIPHGSIDEVQERLAGLGYQTLRIEFDDGNRSLYLDDPDGNCVELMDAVVDWANRPIGS